MAIITPLVGDKVFAGDIKHGFKFMGSIRTKRMNLGEVYGYSYIYKSAGYGIFEFMGYSNERTKYPSIQSVFDSHKVKNLKELEQNSHNIGMLLRQLYPIGAKENLFHIYNGRWCHERNPLTFWRVRKV